MSDVETYWEAVRDKCAEPKPPEWHKLGIQKQQLVIQSINLLIMAISV